MVKLSALVFAASLLSSQSLVHALSPSEIPSDTPISQLLASANQHLAQGETNNALTYYDVAISRDPNNYLTLFRRGATYLQLGRMEKAISDFDKVLEIKPGFEAALLQRANIKAKHGDWEAARKDYTTQGKSGEDIERLEEAKGAASLAFDAEKSGDWEECVSQAGAAIVVASKMLPLRRTRARCRFERGEVQEGMSDLKHVLQMQPGLIEPHIQISAITFYGLADQERGLDQLRKCLHSDPDSKQCKKLYRKQKNLVKTLTKVNLHLEKSQFASAVKLLVPSGEDLGLVQEVKDDVKGMREMKIIPEHSPNELVTQLVESVCKAYHELKNKKSIAWCDEALALNENSLYGLISQSQRHMEAENFDAAIHSLKTAQEHHPGSERLKELLRVADLELRRSKTKDYYKVLGVPRDADELQIKHAWRKMVKVHHPDKAHKQGITKEAAEKKMSQVNEAYEVLSNPELKQRFDQGDDPNDHEQQRQHPFQQGGFQGHPFGGQSGGQQFNFKFGGGGGGFPFG